MSRGRKVNGRKKRSIFRVKGCNQVGRALHKKAERNIRVECHMNRIKSETQRLRNDPVVVIETVEQPKGGDGRIKKRRGKKNKQAIA